MLVGASQGCAIDADIACVLAKRELENWFKSAAASLAGVPGLPNGLAIPANPEEGDGGAWLTNKCKNKIVTANIRSQPTPSSWQMHGLATVPRSFAVVRQALPRP